MKSKNKRRAFIAVLSVFAMSATGAALAGCNKTVGYIDAPASLEAELGTYVIPDYEVVDKNGMILAGYNVHLKSVTNANGEAVNDIVGSAVTIDDAGVYSFVYSAGSKKVKDVTVSIDFADRTAPTINYEDDLPKFFIKGNSYKMPSYTLSGDYDRTKCWAKVFHIAEDKTETEVSITSNRFKVEHSSGSYAIRIHVEDAAGNANDYEYVRKVDGPETVVDHKVLYLDEEFGARQVSCYQSKYTGGYVSKDADGAHAYEGENGAYKVSFDGVSETQYNEGLVVMDVPAIININEYEELYMYVYNDSGKEIRMGSQWWNDTVVPAGKWTRLSWNTREWGNNMSANNTKPVGLVDITGMTIRFIFDYGQKVIPHGDFYLSAMYGTPKVESEITLGENVDISGGKHYINDLIEINATPVEGKTVDYFTVDGEIIPGNTFIVTNESHVIEVHYVDGDLTLDNMTWADRDELTPAGNDAQTQYMGTDENWVMSYDVYGAERGWKFFGVYVGGTNQLLGFELIDETHSKMSGYAGARKWGDGVRLTPEIYSLIRGATEENPVKAVYVRRGNEIRVFLISDDKIYFVGSVDFSAFGVTGNNFGFGARKPGENSPDPATVVNFEAVAGLTKTNLYFENNFKAELTVDEVKAEDKYYIGDYITLEPKASADENKMFAYFKVNGKRIDGNQFYLSGAETSVETVYTNKSTVTLAEGIKTADGKTGEVVVAQDTYLVIDYFGKAPAGKYFIGFNVDGTQVIGTEIYISKDTHTIEVLFAEKEQTGNEKLNEITGDVIYAKDDDGEDKWKPASVEHVTDFRFDGNDAAVDEDSVLKIVTGSDKDGENSFAFNSSLVKNLDTYDEFFFYVYTEAKNIKAGGWWCNDTNLVAGKWTRVTFRRTDAKKPGTIEGNGESIVWKDGLEKFAFRIFNAPAGTTVYVTAVYGVPNAEAEVTIAEDSKDKIIISEASGAKYRVGEKVTLTVQGDVPANKLFAYFTANGKPIEGNVYTLTGDVEFGVVYNSITNLNLGAGVRTSDGRTQVPQGVKVTLVFDENTLTEGKVFDYFKVDGIRIIGDAFVPRGTEHSVTAVLADGAGNLTWVKGEEAAAKEVNYNWSAYSFSGAAVDEATHWAMEAKTYDFTELGSKWYGLDFLVGNNASLQIRLHSAGNANIYAMGANHGDGKLLAELSTSVIDACKAATDEAPVTFTVIRSGETYFVLCNGNLVLRTEFAFNTDDSQFGIGATYCGTWLTAKPMMSYSYRIGENITEYLTTVRVTKTQHVSLDTDKEYLKLGETVKLTAAAAPEGQKFAYFTANGVRFEGDEYVIDKEVEFGVVYNGVTTVTLADGIETADGQKGTLEAVIGVRVYLKLTDGTKYYKAFSVDGEEISGNSFIPTESKTYAVTVETADRVANSNAQTNNVTKAAMHSGSAKVAFTREVSYNGADGAVKDDGSIKISNIDGNDVAVKATEAVGEADLKNFKEVYFYIYTEADGVKAGTYWCNDTDAVKGQWTKVTVYQDMNKNSSVGKPYDADGVKGKLFADGSKGSNFIYRIMGGAGKTVYLTSLYGVPFADVTVKIADDSKDSVTVSDPANGTQYKEGETVTLTAAAAPEGKAFAYFTADGTRIDGDEFTLKAGEVTFGVVYNEVSLITLGTGVTAEHAENGKLTVGRGATVHIEFVGEVPAGKYFASFKVDGELIEGNSFTAERATHSVEAAFAAKEQTGNIKLNEISTVADDGLSYHPTQNDWRPAKTEYVTDVKYTGKDGAVDEGGSLKVTLNSGEQAFALNKTLVNALDEYQEIYFYIYAAKDADVSGIKIGGWWCRDVDIVAGQWTKVSFTRAKAPQNVSEKSVWDENSIDKFVYSFGGAKADTVVYLTAVYGVPYKEVSVTVDDSVKGYIEVSGTFREGQTITLSHKGSPENKQFVYFTINGERHDGNTYELGTEPVVVGAYFTDAQATLTLGAGVATADGETVYALGATVTLVTDSNAPANKVFDRFEVDGEPVNGNTFETSSTNHKVEAIFIDNAADMTWNRTEFEEPEEGVDGNGKYKVVDSAANWVLSYEITKTNADSTSNPGIPNQWYAGVLFRPNQIVGFHMGDNPKYCQWLGSAGSGAGTTWDVLQPSLGGVFDILKNADNEKVTLIFIRQGNKLSSYVKCGGETYLVLKDKVHSAFDTSAGLDFGYGWRTGCGGNPDIENIEWVTGEGKTGLYIDSLIADISYTKASADKEVYRLGDTVTLTAAEAEAGQKFLQFTVNGEPIEGNTFVVTTTETYEVVAVYSNVSEITLGTGVKTADGQTKYAIGATVTLAVNDATAPEDKIIDYFTVGGQRIVGNKFVVEDSAYSVGAVFVDSASQMTWTDGGSAYNYETVMGAASAEWKAKNLDGEVYGSSEYWAVSVNVKHTTEWNSFEFILGSKQSLRVRFHNGNFLGVLLMVDGSETKPDTEFIDAYPNKNPKVVEKLVAGTTITCVRLGDTLKLYADGLLFFTTDCAFDHTGDWFGVGHVDAAAATKPEMTGHKFLTLSEKVEAYVAGLKDLSSATQKSEAQINNIQGATGAATAEYITEGIPAGLEDPHVQENGVLKVTATDSNDIGLKPGWTFDGNVNNYSEIYFYVYIESAEKEALKYVAGGAYWLDGGSIDETNKWVKISFNSATIAQLALTVTQDSNEVKSLNHFTFRIYSQMWQTQYGHEVTDITGKTFYVTSLYGVPKDTETLVQNNTTSYSLVSGNDELTAIVKEGFFPDAE